MFFLSPMNIFILSIAAIFIFGGQAFIQLMMLMFLADTVEYGQWKLGRRNESITFSIQPFINKIGGAIANGIIGVSLIVSGINAAETSADVSQRGLTLMKISMMTIPLILIVAGYFVYRNKYKLDEETFDKIIEDLTDRGEIEKGLE